MVTCDTEMVIRNFSSALKTHKSLGAKPIKKTRRKANRSKQISTIVTYFAVLAVIASVISAGYQSPVEQQISSVANLDSTKVSAAVVPEQTSVDQVVAADLAATAATTANLSVANNVSSRSISMNAKVELAQSNDTAISKPQIAQPTATSQAVIAYKAVEGDTAETIAQKFNISDQTVRWANNLTSNDVSAGADLSIPSVDGVVYTVKDGDNLEEILDKYGADNRETVALNDLEVSGIKPGERIVLAKGVLPETERPGYSAPTKYNSTPSSTTNSTGVLYGGGEAVGNRYAYGYCTWYAYNKRAQLGRPVGSFWGNATTWAAYARGAGYTVNNVPAVGAVMQNSGGWGGYGHVAIVESINADGSVTISEMNGPAGWNVIGYRSITNPGDYNYIH